MDESLRLYKDLASRAISVQVPASHNTLFQPSETTARAYRWCYEEQRGNAAALLRPGNAVCNYCESFHLDKRKKIDKVADIELGKQLESVFQQYINGLLASDSLICARADGDNLHMPDFGIRDTSGGPFIRFFEFKFIFRPFLQVRRRVNQDFECYANSLTLDVSNGKKLANQRALVQGQLRDREVAYVYWYDLPCVKGIFWMLAPAVYQEVDSQEQYERRRVAGDFAQDGRSVGAINKVYLPLLKMADFSSLIAWLRAR